MSTAVSSTQKVQNSVEELNKSILNAARVMHSGAKKEWDQNLNQAVKKKNRHEIKI